MKKTIKLKLSEYIIIISIIMFVSFVIGGATIATINNKGISITSKDEFKELKSVYTEIVNKYYKSIDKEDLIEGAIEGMLSKLNDPHSSFLDVNTSTSFNEKMIGEYKGIGIEILNTDKKETLIVNIFNNSPAFKAGLKVGDIIAEVDGVDVSQFESSEIANKIKYKLEDEVEVKVNRENKIIKFDVIKEHIVIDSIEKKIYNHDNKKIGYLKIEVFAANTYSQFYNGLKELENEKIDELIIDVRNNSGGYLSSVSHLLELFVDKGKVLYQTRSKEETEKFYSLYKSNRNYKIKVLMNKYSASASEILAVGLKESANATLFGETTYGKGTVQEVFYLENGSMTKITTKEWLSPNGNVIDSVGVKADVELDLNNNFEKNIFNVFKY